MRYKNEAEIMRVLDIETWRNLSKEKMIRFAALMPEVDTEVALKIVEQFPVFKDFAKDVVDAMEKAHESTLLANKESHEHVYRALHEIREILAGELAKEDLGWEQKKFLIEQIQETGRITCLKDTENKKFLDVQLSKKLLGIGAALALSVVFVGGKVMADSKDNSDGYPEL